MELRHRGVIREDGRIVIPKDAREKLGIQREKETFYELEVFPNKILITIIKTKP